MTKTMRLSGIFGLMITGSLLLGGAFAAHKAQAAVDPDTGEGTSALQSIIDENDEVSMGAGLTTDEANSVENDLRTIIARIVKAFMTLLGTVAVLLIIYAGFLWMTAGGNEEQVTKAKKLILNATIGLIIILSAYAISAFVIDSMYRASGTVDSESHFFW